jgi:hypothetical protein
MYKYVQKKYLISTNKQICTNMHKKKVPYSSSIPKTENGTERNERNNNLYFFPSIFLKIYSKEKIIEFGLQDVFLFNIL